MNILKFKELDSTNNYSKENIELLEDKTVVVAEFQRSGRGRFNRKWIDLGSKNIYMSIVLKPSEEILPVYANLTQYFCVCLCKVLETLNVHPTIKWPNDVLIEGKKICGILAETIIQNNKLKGIILGVGININADKKMLKNIEKPATAVNLEIKKNINKDEFMQHLLDLFFADYNDFLSSGFNLIKDDYQTFAAGFIKENSQITISVFNKQLSGIFKGYDKNGHIKLETSGKIEKINMGEIA